MTTKRKSGQQRRSRSGAISDPVLQFALGVSEGEIVAGPDVRAACQRHLDDLEKGPTRGLVWDLDAALHAIEFYPTILRLNGGEFENLPFHLLLWQKFIVGSLFGWKRADTGFRRFRVAYIEAGKGSGKSPLVAGIGLYMMTSDAEPRAEIYAAATKRDQAMVLFRDAVAMVELSPPLRAKVKVHGVAERAYNLSFRKYASFFRPIASDTKTQSGPRPHCGLIDEVHEHKDNTVVEMMRAGTKGRRQALIVMITNSGFDRTSVCYVNHEYARKVAAGALMDDSFFGFVCSLDQDDEPFEDRACWPKANPSLGITIQPLYLEEQITQARGMPGKEAVVRRLNFCQWVDAANPWIEFDLWQACENKTLRVADFNGRDLYGGLDLSGVRDLTANAWAAKADDGVIEAFVEFWTPADTMVERGRKDNVNYDEWAKQGHIYAKPGRAINLAAVAIRLSEIQAQANVVGVAYDPYRIKYLEDELTKESIVVDLVPHGQGYYKSQQSGLWMPHSVELLEQLVMAGKLRVLWNPCLRWNSGSAVLVADAKNNRIFDKRKSTGRIDGLVALAMAVGLALQESNEKDFSSFLSNPVIA
ncbi:terminase large subunit [Cupriavidus sp. AcVe19-6a]|uniref:terminase large subunit n=1 Tax=Cupriavidus sp. AcVe19-6a TaxID=2821358 RepID=UPI001AE97624|nr:terminase TerL endonuclease subunit [Cupriavidus sp. AcVe19-6a]MBP0634903.1 terminase large subunit [Cupriavidus sp. AcVe19-6a]